MSTTTRTWTAAQRDAIEHTGGGLLVSAAAGSGKTFVLAERCAHVICDAADPCSVQELLVVTFTEAAAEEMKGRIRKTIEERAAKAANGDGHAARQLSLLDRASISTLHGFCARLLRQHFHLLDLDPAFRILDGDESKLMRLETARELFDRRYDAPDASGRAFRDLVDLYADGDDTRLAALVISAHEALGSVVDPDAWAARARATAAEVATKPLAETALGVAFTDDLRRDLNGVLRECEAAEKFVKSLGGFDGYVTHVCDLYQTVKHLLTLLDDHGLDAVAEVAAGIEVPKLKAVPSTVPDKEVAKRRVDAVNAVIKNGSWRRRLKFTEALWRSGMAATAVHADTLMTLVADFTAAYAAAKGRASGVDFNDLERLTLRLLTDPATGGPSAVARAYHAQFRHVLVDEFQDINEVQDAILTRVSRECLGRPNESNLFCVGDVKQSIYRFRLADPARFLARRHDYATDADRGRIIDLQRNFRSRGPLLDAVNAVFTKLMTQGAVDIDYDESHQLVFGATYPPADERSFHGSPIELHLLPRSIAAGADDEVADDDAAELDRTEREASLVGQRILEIVGRLDRPAMQVVDRDGTVRPATFADVVILLRTVRFKADAIGRQLRAMGVPVRADANTGYFDATEVNDVLSLLRVLDNAHQDVPLAAVLRGPLIRLPNPEAALARVRLAYPAVPGRPLVPFHAAVTRYAADHHDAVAGHLSAALKTLADWRRVARDRPVAELLWTVYQQTGFLAYCGGLPRGEQRQANLLELHDRARQFGTFRRQGLGRFLSFLERLRTESDLGQATVASVADDAVRISSIHKSKGLEFPIVVVPDLGKAFNTADLNGSILMDRELGVGLRVVDEARQVRYPSLAWTVVQQRLRQQTLAEEMRVMYVALTRAKEHLILIGTADEAAVEKWRQQWAGHGTAPFQAETVLAARTPLDWLGPTAASLGAAVFDLTVHPSTDVAEWAQVRAAQPALGAYEAALAELRPVEPPPAGTAASTAVIDGLVRPYPFDDQTQAAAATAVTTLVRGGQPVRQPPKLPAFLTVQSGRPVDRGSATHAVLERLDLSSVESLADVRDEIRRLVAVGQLVPEQSTDVDAEAIAWLLLDTDIGRLMRARSADVRREIPIYFAQPTGTTSPCEDAVMVRGRIDALVPDSGGWVVVDYKTHLGGDSSLDDHLAQLSLYRSAVSRLVPGSDVRSTIVLLHARRIVDVSA